MSGNGAGTGMEVTVEMHRLIREDLHRARAVCFGVAAGSSMPVTAGVLFGTAAILAAAIPT